MINRAISYLCVLYICHSKKLAMNSKKSLILGSLLVITSFSLSAQEKKEPKMTEQQQKEQETWMQYMMPGEMHRLLAQGNGDWHENLVFWMSPEGDATKAESECTNTMILGDRYQESIHKGTMMGMPFEGRGLVGYDNIKKVFQSTWVDNMGTGIMYLEGPFDPKTNSVTLTGKMVDAMTGKTENVREIMTFINEKSQKMEMYMTKNGKEFKTMEISFTKK